MHPGPGAVEAPLAEPVLHRLPGWEVARQQAPLAPGAQHVEDRVQHDAHRVLAAGVPLRVRRELRLSAGRWPGLSSRGDPLEPEVHVEFRGLDAWVIVSNIAGIRTSVYAQY